MSVILMEKLKKKYKIGSVEVPALNGVSFQVDEGEFIAIMGPSGSGKSTLLNMIGCLDRPSSGIYRLDGTDASKLSDTARAHVRNRKIGFVFQSFNLLPRMSALKNCLVPMLYSEARKDVRVAREALTSVGLGARMHHTPMQLSGGEQQRVAIARALINDPPLILGDEPTGNLDTATGVEIMAIFQRLNDQGKTVIIVTHEMEVALHAKRILRFRDGLLESDELITDRVFAVPKTRKTDVVEKAE